MTATAAAAGDRGWRGGIDEHGVERGGLIAASALPAASGRLAALDPWQPWRRRGVGGLAVLASLLADFGVA